MHGLVWISWMREKTGIIIMSTKNILTSLWWTVMKYVRGSTVYWWFYQSLDTFLNIERMLLHDNRDQCDNCKLSLTSQPMHKLLNCKLVCKIILLKLLLHFLEINELNFFPNKPCKIIITRRPPWQLFAHWWGRLWCTVTYRSGCNRMTV